MIIRKTNFIGISTTYDIIFNKFSNKKTLLIIFLLPVLFIVVNNPNFFFSANATNSSNHVVDRSQSNSNTNDCNNNISVQSQTSINGKTTTTSKNNCGDNTSFVSSTSSDNSNLKGIVVSAEYAPHSSVIINSVFGNWSLSTKGDNAKDFKSLFIVRPIYYTNFDKSVSTSNLTKPIKSFNTTSYALSNFISNSVQQQNSDTTYSGKIDIVQKVHSSDIKQPDETNSFKGKDVSISIIGDRILVINFDKQSSLFDMFKNILLVGLIISK